MKMKWFPQAIGSLIVFVIVVQIMGAAIAPYMDMVGKTLAWAIVLLIICAVALVIYLIVLRIGLLDWLRDKFGGSRFND